MEEKRREKMNEKAAWKERKRGEATICKSYTYLQLPGVFGSYSATQESDKPGKRHGSKCKLAILVHISKTITHTHLKKLHH